MIIKKLAYAVLLVLLAVACRKDDKVLLSAPDEIKVEQTGLENLRLTWTNASTSYDGVVIERASQAGGWEFSEIGRVPKGVFVYDDTQHNGDAYYQYRLATFRKDDTSENAYITFRYSRIPAATELKGELTDDGYVLTWKDNCIGEDGYIVLKGRDGEATAEWKVLGENAQSVTDDDIVSGIYEYEVYAYVGASRSAAAKHRFDNTGVPQIKIGNVTPSWHQVHVQFHLVDDGGFACEAGICWRNDGGKAATTNDNSFAFPRSIRTGDAFFGVAKGLAPGRSYYLRPWVKYNGKYQYYPEVKAELMAEPDPLSPVWNDISRQHRMPSAIKLYMTETQVTGRNVVAWYAVADMSSGNLELRTFMTPEPCRPSDAAKGLPEVQLMVNGGYFNGAESSSYVMDQNVEVAPGIRTVKGTYYVDSEKNTAARNYYVTRGAFGVTENQEPSVKWLFGSNEWAYDVPLPVFNSGPVVQPTSTYPSYRQKWNVYSAIGGGPIILDDGHICIDYLSTRDNGDARRYVGNPEMIADDVFGPTVRIARTAIGHTADGKIVIMVVDGSNGSKGVSLDELARLMKGVGCTDVLNLDGGDSSVICVNADGKVLNKPSGGSQREAVSFVALVSR